jgi:DNA-binding SARP family transcriptional activator/CheY-like chemotaxis protein
MSRPSVLLVSNQESYQHWLNSLLHENYALACCSARQASQRQLRPDLLLITWDPTLLAELSALRTRFSSVPVLLLAQEIPASAVIQAFRAGVSDVIQAPSEASLCAALQRWLAPARPSFLRRLTQWPGQWRKRVQQGSSESLHQLSFLMPNPFGSAPRHEADMRGSSPAVIAGEGPRLEAKLLGQVHLVLDGQCLPPVRSRKGMGVLAYLLYHHPRPVLREQLMEQFWADVLPDSARNSLNVALYHLRRAFQEQRPEANPFRYKNGRYSFEEGWQVSVDVADFWHHWRSGYSLESEQGLEAAIGVYEQALECYRGDLMADYIYLEWAEAERESLRETYISILERVAQYWLQQKAYEKVRHLTRKIISADHCREHAYRQLMESLYQMGYPNQAIKAYHRCCAKLKEQLGVPPSEQTVALYQKIRRR